MISFSSVICFHNLYQILMQQAHITMCIFNLVFRFNFNAQQQAVINVRHVNDKYEVSEDFPGLYLWAYLWYAKAISHFKLYGYVCKISLSIMRTNSYNGGMVIQLKWLLQCVICLAFRVICKKKQTENTSQNATKNRGICFGQILNFFPRLVVAALLNCQSYRNAVISSIRFEKGTFYFAYQVWQ